MAGRIWCLIGSARFEDEFHKWNEILSLSGQVVFSLAVFPSWKGTKNWYTPHQKAVLDLVRIYKIDAANRILILNKDKYIGESTCREAVYALGAGKEVFSIEQIGTSLEGRSIPITTLATEPCPLLWPVRERSLGTYMKEQIYGKQKADLEVDWDKVNESLMAKKIGPDPQS